MFRESREFFYCMRDPGEGLEISTGRKSSKLYDNEASREYIT